MRHYLFAALVLLASISTAASPREKTLYIFQGTNDGAEPRDGLINLAGNFFGTTYSGGGNGYKGTVFQLSPPSIRGASWTETVLYDFPNFSTGINPWAGLTSDKAGNLYGTTWLGGSGADGVVFRLAPPRAQGGSWTYTILYNFKGGVDGGQPQAGAVFDQEGNLYGTTEVGGALNQCIGGCGVVFRLSPSSDPNALWNETVLYKFPSNCDGFCAGTLSGVTLDQSGNVYGTTDYGGTGFCGGGGCGTVFRLKRPATKGGAWKHQVLYNFLAGTDGAAPAANLIFDSKGNLYGTTMFGGTASCGGCGTVFRLTPQRNPQKPWVETVLYRFNGGEDGYIPESSVILDQTGAVYGTTAAGGGIGCESKGCGIIFKLTPSGKSWVETVIHRFTGGDGFVPIGSVVRVGSKITGVTQFGGSAKVCTIGCGTVFQVTP
jgi:uncharacterized repeat protein (TIGR03803 family)